MGDLSFLDQEAPIDYVAGLGRGATGFVTSAETGPVSFLSNFGTEIDSNITNNSEEGLLSVVYNAENEEADSIYEQIEARVLNKRKRKITPIDDLSAQELPEKQEKAKLKLGLGLVSILEWSNIPEVGDLTRKNKRNRILEQQRQRVYATPDVLIAQSSAKNFDSMEGDKNNHQTNDQEQTLDLQDYRSTFSRDLDKEKQVLASLRKLEPKNSNLWISSARYEEQLNNFSRARKFINEGCSQVPNNEDIWLESIRIHRGEGLKTCKSIAKEALILNPLSESLWLSAIELESKDDFLSKTKLLKNAIDNLPHSIALWRLLIDSVCFFRETDVQEKIHLLEKATTMCAEEWKFWELLALLKDYSEAKRVLNRARKFIPKDVNVWVAALKLEERENKQASKEKLSTIFTKGISELTKAGAILDSIDWSSLASKASSENYFKTAEVILINFLTRKQKESSLDILLRDAANLENESPLLAEKMYEHLCAEYALEFSCWLKYSEFARRHKPEILFSIYEKAIDQQRSEVLYLKYAEDKSNLQNAFTEARDILQRATLEFPDSELVWITQFELEIKFKHFSRALSMSDALLSKLGQMSPKVWYKFIHFLRFCVAKNMLDVSCESVVEHSNNALELHPLCLKLILQKAQVFQDCDRIEEARKFLVGKIDSIPRPAALWSLVADYDRILYGAPKARSLLDKAIMKIPDLPELWVHKIELEESEKDLIVARQLISKALKLFPSDPDLWIINLRFISKAAHRKVAFADALKETANSDKILSAIGVFLWLEGKFHKAKTWFDRALNEELSNGDTWAWIYGYQLKHGNLCDQDQILASFKDNYHVIKSGKVWLRIKKKPSNLDKSPEELLSLVCRHLIENKDF